MSDPCIAVVAEEPTDFAGIVTMVNGEFVLPVVRERRGCTGGFPTDCADSSLLQHKDVVLVEGDAVSVFEMGFTP